MFWSSPNIVVLYIVIWIIQETLHSWNHLKINLIKKIGTNDKLLRILGITEELNDTVCIPREEEEDQQLNEMMQRLGKFLAALIWLLLVFNQKNKNARLKNIICFISGLWLGLKKLKSKRKSSFSKLFRRRSKKGLVEGWSPREQKLDWWITLHAGD